MRVGGTEVALSRVSVASPVRVEEQNDLAIRFLGGTRSASVDATTAGEIGEDIRTLYVDFDDQHNRYKPWRAAVAESYTEGFTDSSWEEAAAWPCVNNTLSVPLSLSKRDRLFHKVGMLEVVVGSRRLTPSVKDLMVPTGIRCVTTVERLSCGSSCAQSRNGATGTRSGEERQRAERHPASAVTHGGDKVSVLVKAGSSLKKTLGKGANGRGRGQWDLPRRSHEFELEGTGGGRACVVSTKRRLGRQLAPRFPSGGGPADGEKRTGGEWALVGVDVSRGGPVMWCEVFIRCRAAVTKGIVCDPGKRDDGLLQFHERVRRRVPEAAERFPDTVCAPPGEDALQELLKSWGGGGACALGALTRVCPRQRRRRTARDACGGSRMSKGCYHWTR